MLVTLQSQNDLLIRYRALMRDPSDGTSATRWKDSEYYYAINRALTSWANRVRVPWLHTLDDGWSNSIYAYTLPDYMDSYIRPQVQSPASAWRGLASDGSVFTWDDLNGWTLEPDGSGGLVLRWQTPPINAPGRIIWYMPVSTVPVDLALLAGAITDEEDSATVHVPTGFMPGRVGWVNINGEWIRYSDIERGTDSITLFNLIRGDYGTAPGTHDAGLPVYWGVAVDREDLWGVLDDQVMEHLHAMFMTNASNTETDTHAVMMKYHGDRVQGFWRNYLPSWRPRILLTREAMGARVY